MNLLQKIFTTLYSLAIVLWYASKVVISSKKSNTSPAYTTQCAHAAAIKILKLVRASWDIQVKQNIVFERERAYIFMSNHLSVYDPPLIFATMPGHIRFIAKKELFDFPVFGKALKYSDTFCVYAGNDKLCNSAFKQIKEVAIAKGLRIWTFPEGTRSRTGQLLPFKAGVFRLALELDAIIIPVGIWGTQHILPAKTWLFGKPGQALRICVGEAIDSRDFKNIPLPQLISRVKNTIRELIDQK